MPKLLDSGHVTCHTHFLCLLPAVFSPILYILLRVHSDKCFMNSTKPLQCEVLFRKEHTLCLCMQHAHEYCVSGLYSSPCLYLKHNVLEPGSCLHLQLKSAWVGPIDRTSLYPWVPSPTQDMVYKPSLAQTLCES